MTRIQVFKEFWGKSLKWKFLIIQLLLQFPAFVFHELCHLLFLGIYIFIFSDYQKLSFSGSYFFKKVSDSELGGYGLSITWTSYSSFWSIAVSIAPLIGYISLWVFLFPFIDSIHYQLLLGWYLGFGFGQFMLSKQDVESIEKTIKRSSLKGKEKFLILTQQLHVIIKYTKPWQY